MTSLVAVEEARALVQTGLTDAQLQDVIEREEAALIRMIGPHHAAGLTVTETLHGDRNRNLYLKRRIASVTSIVEYLTSTVGTPLDALNFQVWGDEGRVERLLAGTKWPSCPIVVTYAPQDDNLERKAAIIDLLRLALSRTGLMSESVAGEYAYTAFENTDEERGRVLRRLKFFNL